MAQVLIIDDDPAQLHVREAVLREAGFSVCTSGDAQAALDLLRNPGITESLGVIVTDHVTHEAMLTYFRMADLYISMSEHEGFGKPLIESMLLNQPILAYAATSVPGTLVAA